MTVVVWVTCRCAEVTTQTILKESIMGNTRLSKKEIRILNALDVLGFKYIARDNDEGSLLFAYYTKPIKKQSYWHHNEDTTWSFIDHSYCIDSYLFPFIQFEDEQPVVIKNLLKEKGERK